MDYFIWLSTKDSMVKTNTFNYRVIKYNPAYRNEQGWYLRDDWTVYNDKIISNM